MYTYSLCSQSKTHFHLIFTNTHVQPIFTKTLAHLIFTNTHVQPVFTMIFSQLRPAFFVVALFMFFAVCLIFGLFFSVISIIKIDSYGMTL